MNYKTTLEKTNSLPDVNKTQTTTLQIQRETIRQLSEQDLKELWGGSNGSNPRAA